MADSPWQPLLLVVVLVAGCQSSPTTSTPTPLQPTKASTASPTQEPPLSTATQAITPSPAPTPTLSPTPEPPFITLLFTGIIVPARCVQAKIDATGNPDYPYEEVRDLFHQVDLTIGTLNATISDFPPRTGCVSTFLLTGGSENADALARAGVGVMSVATNHIKNCGVSNCGDKAFLDTLENLERVGILPVGAGNNLDQALQPAVVTLRGVRFAFVSFGEIEATAFADDETPGIAVLSEENLEAAIASARATSDVVIAMPHWGPEYSPIPNHSQRRFARLAVTAGADLVVGNHTHVVQAVETIAGTPVFYGLGNFVFDQDWSRETQQGVLLRVTFLGNRYVGHDLIPTHVDGDGRVRIAGMTEAVEILGRIEAASQGLPK